MQRYCCPECFGDHGLRKDVIPSLDPIEGECSFCGSQAVELIKPDSLTELFEMLISIYEPNPEGKSIAQLLKEDWLLFHHETMDTAHTKELLAEVLNDGEIVRQSFSPSPKFISEGLARWESLRDELMYKNRYFLDEALDSDRLEELLQFLSMKFDSREIWHRARITSGTSELSIDQMGAPPSHMASHGRANPSGIPYLYLGSTPQTAVSEIRPHTGEKAYVGEFEITSPLTVVDLRTPRKLVSPFLLEDAGAIGQLRADIPFLERLGSELTRPVLPRSAAIDYIPSQYLCEFIKKVGYDGVIYRSSVSDGINLALFDPNKALARKVDVFCISQVSVTIEPSNG